MRRTSNGTALLGGSPFRLIRLSSTGSRLLDQWLAGDDRAQSSEADELRTRLIRAGMVHPIPGVGDTLPPAAFVIPVHDDADGLDRCLKALRSQAPTAQIVVVDDASLDSAAIAAAAARHHVELIRHATNQGPAASRNTGWHRVAEQPSDTSRASGTSQPGDTSQPSVTSPGEVTLRPEMVVFLDADVVVMPGAVATMLAHFDDPGVAAVASRVRAAAGSGSIAGYEADNSSLDMGADPAIVFPGTRISYVPSAALAVRTDVLQTSQGFDQTLRFGEDVDLVWRLVDQGHLVRYEPRSVVAHRNRSSLKALARQRFSYGSSAAALAERHGNKVAPLQLPANVVATSVVGLFGSSRLRVLAVIAAAAAVVPLARKLGGKVDDPCTEAARLTLMTHGYAMQGLATAATRSWAPLLLLAPRSRKALGVALVVPAIIDWIRDRPALDPGSYLGIRVLDHGAYCAGVWSGVLRSRSVAALLPNVRFTERNDD